MTTNQEGKHASFRTIGGGSGEYNGDSIAAMVADGASGSSYNEIMVSWLQIRISDTTVTNINDLQQAFAAQEGFDTWSSVNTFSAVSRNWEELTADNWEDTTTNWEDLT